MTPKEIADWARSITSPYDRWVGWRDNGDGTVVVVLHTTAWGCTPKEGGHAYDVLHLGPGTPSKTPTILNRLDCIRAGDIDAAFVIYDEHAPRGYEKKRPQTVTEYDQKGYFIFGKKAPGSDMNGLMGLPSWRKRRGRRR